MNPWSFSTSLVFITTSLLLKFPGFCFKTVWTALLKAPQAFPPAMIGFMSAEVSLAWHPLSRMPSSGFKRSGKSMSPTRGSRNPRLASDPKSANKWVAMSGVLMFVREEKCWRREAKGIVLGLKESDFAVSGSWTEVGPICSFSLSIRPPLWHESERIVKLAPFGNRFTKCRKSTSVYHGNGERKL